MHWKRAIQLGGVTVLFLATTALAGDRPRLAYPCHTATQPLSLEAGFDDPCWRPAPVAGPMVLYLAEDQEAEPTTHFRALVDDQSLWIIVRAFEPNMAGLVATHTRHDDAIFLDDSIELFVDPLHDHDHYYQLVANSVGAQYESFRTDAGWNGRWEAKARREADAWVLTVRIPLSTLEAKRPGPGTVWGFNCCRNRLADKGHHQLSQWSPTVAGFHDPENFGHLLFTNETAEAGLARAAAGLRARHGALDIVIPDGHLVVNADGSFQRTTYAAGIAALHETLARRVKELRTLLPRAKGSPETQTVEAALAAADKVLGTSTDAGDRRALPLKHALEVCISKADDAYWQLRLHIVLTEP
jgi:hypothetical protein